jgi:hypothetical protein
MQIPNWLAIAGLLLCLGYAGTLPVTGQHRIKLKHLYPAIHAIQG